MAKKDYRQCKILVFSAQRVASSSTFRWGYLERALVAILALS